MSARVNRFYVLLLALFVPVLTASRIAAAAESDISGHWTGAVTIQGTDLKIEIDFKKAEAAWAGG